MVWAGGTGTVVGLLCCFTPVLPIVLGAIGASGLLAYVYSDAVLLPFAGLSFLMMIVGLRMGRRDERN